MNIPEMVERESVKLRLCIGISFMVIFYVVIDLLQLRIQPPYGTLFLVFTFLIGASFPEWMTKIQKVEDVKYN